MLAPDNRIFYKKGLCGITNTQNTCFINTMIHCINANRDLAVIFFNKTYHINISSPCKNIIEQWIILSKFLWDKNCVITPTSFLNNLHNLLQTKKSNIVIGNHEDAQEFSQLLLEFFHEGLSNKVKISIEGLPKNKIDKKAIVAYKIWKTFFENEFSPIINMYFGQFNSIITKDNEITENYEPYSNISLDIPDTNYTTLYECFNKFTAEEIIETGDTKVNISKCSRFWSFPNHLIIFIKRYSNNNILNVKNKTIIDFPIENLDLSEYCTGYNQQKQIFNLYAVSNHDGNCNFGHYYAYIKNLDGNWYKFNDERVTLLNKNNIVSQSAYCLFYKKI